MMLSPVQVVLDIRCASCIFFVVPTNRFGNTAGAPFRGQCRRNPPVLDMIGDGNGPRSLFPMVHVDSFCGEHATLAEPDE